MKKTLVLGALMITAFSQLRSQDTLRAKDSSVLEWVDPAQVATITVQGEKSRLPSAEEQKRPSPYTVKFKKDGPIILGLLAANAGGLYLIQNKKDLTPEQLATKTRDKIPGFDRSNAGYYNEQANDDSYIPFYASFAWPVVMMVVDGDQSRHFGQVFSMYIETMAVTGAMYSLTAGAISRSRPLVYGTEAPIGTRMSKNSQRSFYAGHTAATAASAFFTAKVFSDMNPGSRLKPVVWVVAAALPAVVGYQRWRAGQHFLSDNLLGYAVGAATGILIPHWHRTRKSSNVSIYPGFGRDYQGLSIVYKFR
ncbi:MAG TPA: phosphatase PAP2 family protein [Chitinophagaceae bacterium]